MIVESNKWLINMQEMVGFAAMNANNDFLVYMIMFDKTLYRTQCFNKNILQI